MRQQSHIPGYMIRDSRWGHQVHGHSEAIHGAETQDRAFAARYAELAERYDLHVEVGQFSHDGPPFFAAIMPKVIARRLAGLEEDEDGVAIKLSWGILNRMPGYADGQLTRRDAIEQASVQYYDATQNGVAPLPE